MQRAQTLKINKGSELLSDKELIFHVINGDLETFDIIVERYKNRLITFVFRFVKDYDVSEDIVQETFLRVFRKCRNYKEIAEFSTWIYTIAGNLAKRELRRRKKWEFLSIDETNDNSRNFDIPDPGMKPDRAAALKILEENVQEAIDSLKIRYKEVLILRDIEGMSYYQIAEIADVPVGTVKSRVNRARVKLQEKLKGHTPSDELFH